MHLCDTVLVVEDEEGIRESLKLLLEVEGYKVLTAANGKFALEILNKMERPCLILLDLMMPVMNGWEFSKAIKANHILAPIPIVLVTAFADEVGVLKNLPIVKKPVDHDLLMVLVKKYCSNAKAIGRT